jgi:hypothetical protein
MAAITAIPDILVAAEGDYKARPYKCAVALSRGQIVGTDSSGNAIPFPIAANTRTMYGVLGVAEDAAAVGDSVSVIYAGVVNVACGDDTTGWSIGQAIRVGTYVGAGLATTTYTDSNIIGTALETVAPATSPKYGKVLLKLR